MKRILMASTASLVVAAFCAPSLAAEKITLGLGGYMEQYIGFADNESDPGRTDYRSFDVQSDTEIWFEGSTTLDNGLKFAVKIEMEADGEDAGTSNIDESYLDISSASFGALRIGYEDAATSLMHNVAPNYGPSFDDADTWVVSNIVNQTDSYILLGQGDEAKISYFTPRFYGLQAGVTYVPELENGRASGNGSNTTPMPNAINGAGDAWFAALNYTAEFGGLGVAADYGYGRASGALNDYTAGTLDQNIRSADGHQVGLVLTYGGFEFGGGWQYSNEVHGSLAAGNSAANEGTVWEIGAGYKPGPWGVSISYLRSEQTAALSVPGDDEANITALSGVYNLGPGIDVHGSLYYVDYDSETPNNDANFNSGGWAVVGGLVLSF